MAGWHQLAVPTFCERLIGFSVPQGDTVLIVSYEGMHLMRFGTPITVETDPEYCEYDLYDPESGIWRYRDREWDIIGLSPGHPILTGLDGEQLILNKDTETILVGRQSSIDGLGVFPFLED